jgi:hypothetical protein
MNTEIEIESLADLGELGVQRLCCDMLLHSSVDLEHDRHCNGKVRGTVLIIRIDFRALR